VIYKKEWLEYLATQDYIKHNASALSGFSLFHYKNNFKTMVAIEYKSNVEMSVSVLVSVYQIRLRIFMNRRRVKI